jgi:hypothetical protein
MEANSNTQKWLHVKDKKNKKTSLNKIFKKESLFNFLINLFLNNSQRALKLFKN